MNKLYEFVKESNAIEGIHRAPTKKEIKAHEDFLALEYINVSDLEKFVKKVANAPLRRDPYLPNITIGGHYPPSNGPHIEKKLTDLLKQVNNNISNKY